MTDLLRTALVVVFFQSILCNSAIADNNAHFLRVTLSREKSTSTLTLTDNTPIEFLSFISTALEADSLFPIEQFKVESYRNFFKSPNSSSGMERLPGDTLSQASAPELTMVIYLDGQTGGRTALLSPSPEFPLYLTIELGIELRKAEIADIRLISHDHLIKIMSAVDADLCDNGQTEPSRQYLEDDVRAFPSSDLGN